MVEQQKKACPHFGLALLRKQGLLLIQMFKCNSSQDGQPASSHEKWQPVPEVLGEVALPNVSWLVVLTCKELNL
jgi:hypothetical protein